MRDWQENLDDVLNMAWATLRGHRGARGDFPGIATLATIGEDGAPSARAVVLRSVDQAAGTVDIYSDTQTAKLREVEADPRVAVVVWSTEHKIQLRLRGKVTILTGNDAQAEWERVPDHGVVNYGVTPPPGTEIPAPNAYERRPVQSRFAVLRVIIDSIDLVHLGEPFHIRAAFSRDRGWAGRWLAP